MLPRRRITSLTLLSILVLSIWYLNLFHSFSDPIDGRSHPGHVKQKPSDEHLAAVTSNEESQSAAPDGASDEADLALGTAETPAAKPKTPGTSASSSDEVSTDILLDDRPPPDSSSSQPEQYDVPVPKIKTQSKQFIFGTRRFVEKYGVDTLRELPKSKPGRLPTLQAKAKSETPDQRKKRMGRLDAVKESFAHSWAGYKMHAWKKDELQPLDGGSTSGFGGWAATLVDALSTLWIMGMKSEFKEAVEAIKDIDFTDTEEETLNVFETTIRYLGGLLGAYDLSHGNEEFPILLKKAVEVGDFLYCAFDTPNRMPVTRWKWQKALAGEDQAAGRSTLIAEIGSLTLEFTRLSQLTGDHKYYDAVTRVMEELEKQQETTKLPGLWPVVMNAEQITFKDNGFTLGGMADSTYEYLPKQHMLLGGGDDMYEKMYDKAIKPAMTHLFFQPMLPDEADVLISGSVSVEGTDNVKLKPEGQHLGCFTGGMVGIAAKLFDHPPHLNMARKLVDGCIWTYENMPHGIGPETFVMIPCAKDSGCKWDESKWDSELIENSKFKSSIDVGDFEKYKTDKEKSRHLMSSLHLPKGFLDIPDGRYVLRPEAIESVFIHWRLTGDEDLPEKAWKMFTAIENVTRTDIANSEIEDVSAEEPVKQNRMESFWMAETLKYFFLIFSEPDVVSLDDYVFNTEAHPFRRPGSHSTKAVS